VSGVLQPVDPDILAAATAGVGSLVEAILKEPDALVYFLLNVGDGDTQLLLLPPDSNDGIRRLAIVDVATTKKLPDLIEKLHQVEVPSEAGTKRLIQKPGSPGQIRLLVATHPHFDHIGGMGELLAKYNGLHNRKPTAPAEGDDADGVTLSEADRLTPYASDACIDQFWESGYFFPSPSFHKLMAALETSRGSAACSPPAGPPPTWTQ
jgi:glyoxylase-like metal-dependent hydrolase (beta-lactamase superfamily II)